MASAGLLAAHVLPRIAPPSTTAFQRNYVDPSRPAVLAGLVSAWESRDWSLDHLCSTFADVLVTTLRTDRGRVIMDAPEGAVQERARLGTFIGRLTGGADDRYVSSRMEGLPEALRRNAPRPPYCERAGLNNGNLWIGAAGTLARLHRDLPDNLHAVVSGRKRFTLVAPQQSALLYPNAIFDAFPNGCHVDIENPDVVRFPKVRGVETFFAELEAGDAIYVPRRWWHHVRTQEISVSINFWWATRWTRAVLTASDYFKRLRRIGPLWTPRFAPQ